jgi:hypothetical protein
MFLVAIAIGFLVLGRVIGRELSRGAALACSLVAFGMLLVQAFGGERFRVGSFAIGWLFAVAFAIGLGVGPVLAYYASADLGTITQAAGATARSLSRWRRAASLSAGTSPAGYGRSPMPSSRSSW